MHVLYCGRPECNLPGAADTLNYKMHKVERAMAIFVERHGMSAIITLDQFIAMEEDEPKSSGGVSRTSPRLEQFANMMLDVPFNLWTPQGTPVHSNSSLDQDTLNLMTILDESGKVEDDIVKQSIADLTYESSQKFD